MYKCHSTKDGRDELDGCFWEVLILYMKWKNINIK